MTIKFLATTAFLVMCVSSACQADPQVKKADVLVSVVVLTQQCSRHFKVCTAPATVEQTPTMKTVNY